MRFLKHKSLMRLLFLSYCGLMLWLLFIRARDINVTDYWAQFSARVNLIPFRSIGRMLTTLRENPRWDVFLVVVYNLGGNIGMFLPLGFCLPALFPGQRRFGRCMMSVAGIMSAVEFVQLVTLRGFCEIDDVILNVLCAAIGYGLWKLTDN